MAFKDETIVVRYKDTGHIVTRNHLNKFTLWLDGKRIATLDNPNEFDDIVYGEEINESKTNEIKPKKSVAKRATKCI